MHIDQTKLKNDNNQLLAALREKNRKHAQTQELYDRLKAKEMTAATRNAAFDSVDDVLQSVVRGQVQGHGQQGQGPTDTQLRRQGPNPLGHFSGGRRSTSPRKGLGLHHIDPAGNVERGPMGPPPIPRPGRGMGNSGFGIRASLYTLPLPLPLPPPPPPHVF